MRRLLTSAAFLMLISAQFALGDLVVTVPNAVLLPDTPNQEVVILVSGTDLVTNVNFRAAINNGVSPSPVFQGSTTTRNNDGTDYFRNASIWNAHDAEEFGDAPLWNPLTSTGLPLFADSGAAFDVADPPNNTLGDGVLVTAIIDTSNIFSGTYAFRAGDHPDPVFIAPGIALQDTNLSNGGTTIFPTFVPGSISIVPEPSAFLMGFVVIGLVATRNCKQLLQWFTSK